MEHGVQRDGCAYKYLWPMEDRFVLMRPLEPWMSWPSSKKNSYNSLDQSVSQHSTQYTVSVQAVLKFSDTTIMGKKNWNINGTCMCMWELLHSFLSFYSSSYTLLSILRGPSTLMDTGDCLSFHKPKALLTSHL